MTYATLERRHYKAGLVVAVLLALTGDTGELVLATVGLALILRKRLRLGLLIVVVAGAALVVPGLFGPHALGTSLPGIYGRLGQGASSPLGVLANIVRYPGLAVARLEHHLPDL